MILVRDPFAVQHWLALTLAVDLTVSGGDAAPRLARDVLDQKQTASRPQLLEHLEEFESVSVLSPASFTGPVFLLAYLGRQCGDHYGGVRWN
jgi:hypothetical protein